MEYKEFCYKIAREAGKIIKDNFLNVKTEFKEDTSPVTISDKTINQLLIDEISKIYPEHNVIGEEESSENQDSDYKWVCDPIDGTIPYTLGLPISSFSLALTYKGEVIVGVVYDPYCDRLFYAEKNKGAFLNDKKITVNQETDKSKYSLAMENWSQATYDITKIEKELSDNGIKTMRLCSIALPSVLIASGKIAGTIFPANTAHDMAAVKIIVEEAGGKVTDLFGNEQRYDKPIKGCIASNGLIHDYLLEIVTKHIKDK